MVRRHQLSKLGYFEVTIRASMGQHIVNSNNERAFIISQLQDLLGRRSLFEEFGTNHQLATHIDMLAFSIISSDVKFILFSITRSAVQTFTNLVVASLVEYQQDWRGGWMNNQPRKSTGLFNNRNSDPRVTIKRLAGQYDALNKSVELHLRHSDWEYDRYSSIGFYLHDRRGDWMHIWRMSRLYDNNVDNYRRLLVRDDIAWVMAAPSASAQSSGLGTSFSPS